MLIDLLSDVILGILCSVNACHNTAHCTCQRTEKATLSK